MQAGRAQEHCVGTENNVYWHKLMEMIGKAVPFSGEMQFNAT